MKFAAVVERLRVLQNPYPGLRHFEIAESHLFFGRDQQIAELVGRLERQRFLAVVGMSGCGKSSLVRAGLIPALERGRVRDAARRWRTAIMKPRGAPFENLAYALQEVGLDGSALRTSSHGLIEAARPLAARDESLLLVVDQFEEIFRYKDRSVVAEDKPRHQALAADAAEFVQLLLASSREEPPIYIVLTMRSDYMGDCAEFRDLPETLNDAQYLVPRMTREQRKEAILGPLGRVEIEPNLVQRQLNDAGDEPDQLPILQHALMRTWQRWRTADPDQRRGIELQDYLDIGGFDGALNQHADELLATVQQDVAARIFKRLTARGRSNRERRDPATLRELWAVCAADTPEARAQVTRVVDVFRQGDATFLLPRQDEVATLEADTQIDITHESLIRQWKRLRNQWLPEEQRSAKTFVELVDRARKWKGEHGEPLLGFDLRDARAWDKDRNPAPAWANHYADSSALSDVLEFLAASQVRDKNQILRKWLLRFGAPLLVVFALLAAFALHQREAAVGSAQQADQAAKEAKRQQEIADKQREIAITEQLIADKQREIADAAKIAADKERDAANLARLDAVQQRREADRQRDLAERARTAAETDRVAAIKARADAELRREQAETAQKEAEAAKARAETAARLAEEQRVIADHALKEGLTQKDAAQRANVELASKNQENDALTKYVEGNAAPTPAGGSAGRVTVAVTRANGDPLGRAATISVARVSGESLPFTLTTSLSNKKSSTLVLSKLPLATPLRFSIGASKYRTVGRFVLVSATDAQNNLTVALPLAPDAVDDVEFPAYATLPAEMRRILDASSDVEGFRGLAGARLYGAFSDLQRAQLLNIFAKSSATEVTAGRTPLSYIERLTAVSEARLTARVTPELAGALRASSSFTSVSGILRRPAPGWSFADSVKTVDRFLNLQITTFAQVRTSGGDDDRPRLADLDIDEAAGLRQMFQILDAPPRTAHPYDIHELLLFDKIDPLYRLEP